MNKKYLACILFIITEMVGTIFLVYYLTDGFHRTIKFKSIEKYKIFDKYEWNFNSNISQYTTILYKEKHSDTKEFIIVESLVLFNQGTVLLNQLSCVFNIDSKLIIENQVQITSINKNNLFLLKFTLDISNQTNKVINLNYISISIIDRRYYGKFIITYKRPHIISFKTNKKTMINCVHMTRCSEECSEYQKKVNSWSEILYKIGYDKIQLYVIQANQTFKDDLIKNDKYSLIELVDYKLSNEDLCKWHKSEFDKKQNQLNKMLYLNCVNSVKSIFTITSDWWFGLHEKINTNACYLQHKYNYEFLTNLDLDEIIFPRLYDLNLNSNLISLILNNSNSDRHNLYDYTKKLTNGQNIAYLLFSHSLYISSHQEFLVQIKNFNLSKPELYFPKSKLNFQIDISQINQFLKIKDLAFLAQNVSEKHSFKYDIHYKFLNTIITNCPYRLGKSIYVTKNTITINQHDADNIRHGTYRRDLKFEDGYIVGHFRDDSSICYQNINNSINLIRFDLEYFMFLLKNLNI